MKLPAPREADVARQIREYLERVHHLVLMRVDPGRGRLRVWNAGTPDILGCLPGGRMLAIEVKRPGARKRANEARQAEMLTYLRSQGALVIVASSVEEVQTLMEGRNR